ncbi:MAG TPA: ester cyclase [Chloroflexia bacterium]|nr:ester cyclase [Chloroflexia bacterium]
MNTDANKEVVRRWIDGWNTRGVDAVDELFAANFTDQQLVRTLDVPLTLESFKERFRTLEKSLEHVHFEEKDMIAEGDQVLVRWTMSGIQVGPYLGLPATGRSFQVDGVNIFRIADGRIVERWSFYDVPSFLAQVGGKIVPQESQ